MARLSAPSAFLQADAHDTGLHSVDLAAGKPAFPACPAAPVLSQLTATTASYPYCLFAFRCARSRAVASYPNNAMLALPLGLRCALPTCCTPLLAAEAQTHSRPPPPALSPPRLRTPRSPGGGVSSSGVRQGHGSKLLAGVASAYRAASLFLTIAKLRGGAARRPKSICACAVAWQEGEVSLGVMMPGQESGGSLFRFAFQRRASRQPWEASLCLDLVADT